MQEDLLYPDNTSRKNIVLGEKTISQYIFGGELKKPILYPLTTVSGIIITRGYPFDIVEGERTDHKHHVGHWMNYGDVNGLDFWNNSSEKAEEQMHKYGSIVHHEFDQYDEKKSLTNLASTAFWKDSQGDILLEEKISFVFRDIGQMRVIDRTSTLLARQDLSFDDNKEGMFGIRVARFLELPNEKPAFYTGKDGKQLPEKISSTYGATGNYVNSEGFTGNDVWGKRAAWTKLYGVKDDTLVEVFIFDHSDNIGYPCYWHARDYGLFSANPLGQGIFSKGKEELNFKLNKGDQVTFKYRIVINEKNPLTKNQIEEISSF